MRLLASHINVLVLQMLVSRRNAGFYSYHIQMLLHDFGTSFQSRKCCKISRALHECNRWLNLLMNYWFCRGLARNFTLIRQNSIHSAAQKCRLKCFLLHNPGQVNHIMRVYNKNRQKGKPGKVQSFKIQSNESWTQIIKSEPDRTENVHAVPFPKK